MSSSSSDPNTGSTNTNANTTTNANDSTAGFQSDLAADRDGYFARLAGRVFGSGDNGFLATFADEQRLERLDGCTALEGDLGQCQRVRRKMEEVLEETESGGGGGRGFWGRRGNNKSKTDADEMDGTDASTYVPSQSATKTRIARFYDWGEPDGGATAAAPDATAASANGSAAAAAASPPSCHRESHSVWACRALAVGCADHLVPLRKCLRRTGSAAVHYEGSGNALAEDGGAIGGTGSVDECVLEQQALAQCVNVKLDELDKRFRERQRAKQ